MAWENFYEMFPQGVAEVDGKPITYQDLLRNGTSCVSYVKLKPVRNMTQEVKRYSYYDNGDFIITKEYDIFPPACIDNVPLLNAYAQKAYNDFCAQHNIAYNPHSQGTLHVTSDVDDTDLQQQAIECHKDCLINSQPFDQFINNQR